MASFQINEFFGIQQHKDGSLLPVGSAYDCRNVLTVDGNLSVAPGFVKYIADAIPGDDALLRIIIGRALTPKIYVVTENTIYLYDTDAWATLYEFDAPITSEQVDYVQTQIGTDDCILVASGSEQIIKINMTDDAAELFGTGAYSFEGTVSSYNAGTKVVTLSAALSAEALRHAPLDGITINGTWLEVASATGSTVTLAETPAVAPASPNAATIRGGGSTAEVNYMEMYYGRLVSAGDPLNPCRLYWSAVPGDGRTIEDWLSVTGSVDAGGGFLDVGDASGDPIIGIITLATELFIKKRYSVYHLFGDSPSTFVLQRVETFGEPTSNASLVVKYNVPYFLTRSGIKYYDGTGVLPINAGLRYLNDFIKTIVSVSKSKGLHADNMLYFSCKCDAASTYDDTMIVYDIARVFTGSSGDGSYTIRDGFEIADMTQFDDQIYLINGERYVFLFGTGTSYDGVPIDAYWQTQTTDLGDKAYKKQVTSLLFRGAAGSIKASVISDGKQRSKEREVVNSTPAAVDVPIATDRATAFSIRLANMNGSVFSIKGGLQIIYDAAESKGKV